MKKFTNAIIYGHKEANDILVDNGVIKEIGKDRFGFNGMFSLIILDNSDRL